MHPILVKVLPASVRRGYYELVDYQIPRWTNWHLIWYKIRYLVSPAFRKAERDRAELVQRLLQALTAGYQDQFYAEGSALKVEDLAPTMRLITFDPVHLKRSTFESVFIRKLKYKT
jgi:hypothetical protein